MIHHIDCLEFMRGMAERGERVNAIITDPPYLYLNHKLDRKFNEREFFELASKITDKIVFFGRGDSFYKWNLLCAELGFEFKEEIIWDKRRVSNPTNPLKRIHETISVRMKKNNQINKVKEKKYRRDYRKGDIQKLFDDLLRMRELLADTPRAKEARDFLVNGKRIYGFLAKKTKDSAYGSKNLKRENDLVKRIRTELEGVELQSIITEPRKMYEEEHPTQKPINLLRKLVLLISEKGDMIFDPFAGSGSTGIASLIEGRKFIGCEIDAEYFDIAKRRVEETDKALRQSLFYGID